MGFSKWLIHIVDVQSVASTTTANTGEVTNNYSTASADTPCRLVRQQQREPNERLGEMVERSDYVLFKPDVTITTDYRLTNFRLADGTAYDAKVWEIDSVLQRNATGGKHIRVNVHRVD